MHGLTKRLAVASATVAACGTLALAGATAAGASTHPHISNATTVCGGQCFDLSNKQLDGLSGPDFIQNAVGGVHGTALNLRQAGNAKVNEDFTPSLTGLVSDFCGLLPSDLFNPTSYICTHFSGSPVFEADFSPDSNESGLCVGVRTAGVAQRVSLRPCGVDNRTLWVADTLHPGGGGYFPWLNASDKNFSHPLVLSFAEFSKHPVHVLRIDRENLSGGGVPDRQQFLVSAGPAA